MTRSFTNHRTAAVIAAALALGIAAALALGIAAPTASARPIDQAPTFQPTDAAARPVGAGATQHHWDHSQSPGAYICGTSYSMNSVDGKYCPPRHATPIASLPPATAASARPDPAPSGTGQSQTTTAAPVARPNPDQQAAQSLSGAPPILPRVPASEQAAINRAQAGEAQALSYSLPPTARYSSAELNAYANAVHPVAAATHPSETYPAAGPNPDGQTPVDAPATIVRVSTPSSGFD
ncbi:MAG: hypothetical protein JOZ95_24655, partial [Solirubrobacterales bacterium]|nr:hypothetical protein [Solirubrobacterales bacterium]